jgi:hypothetical protein
MVSIKRFQSDSLLSLELNLFLFAQGFKHAIALVCWFSAIALSFTLVCNMVHKKFMNKILSKEYTSRYNKKKKNLDIKHIMSTSFKKIRSIQTCRRGLTNEDNNRCKKESTYNGYQMQCIYRQNYCKTNELCHVLRVVNSWVLYFLILFGSKMISKNLRSLSSILLSIKF